MASYRERKSDPAEIMILDGYTVDYCENQPDLQQEGGRFFFNVVKEGDNVIFATDEDSERQMWVQAIYRATGQNHRPTPPTQPARISNTQISRMQGGKLLLKSSSTGSRAKKGRMRERQGTAGWLAFSWMPCPLLPGLPASSIVPIRSNFFSSFLGNIFLSSLMMWQSSRRKSDFPFLTMLNTFSAA